jgi:hypothetical protein
MTNMFVCTLEDEAMDWFEFCSLEEISSLARLIEAFCKHLDKEEESVEDLIYAYHY